MFTIQEAVTIFEAFVREHRRSAVMKGEEFDGLGFWQGFKKIFLKEVKPVGITMVSNPGLEEFEKENPELDPIEFYHFVFQQVRIPAAEEIPLVKLMQLALNIAQLDSLEIPLRPGKKLTEGFWPLDREQIAHYLQFNLSPLASYQHPSWNEEMDEELMAELNALIAEH